MILNYFPCAFRALHYPLNISLEWSNVSFHNVFRKQWPAHDACLMAWAWSPRFKGLLYNKLMARQKHQYIARRGCVPAVSKPQKPSWAGEAPPTSPHLFSPYLDMESVKPFCRKYSENLIYLSWYIKVEWRPNTKDGSSPFINVKSKLDMGTLHVHFHSGNIYLGRGKLCLKN